MIPELFLICALSLPATHYRPMLAECPLVDELQKLRDFIIERNPGAEIDVIPDGQNPQGVEWEIYPLIWRDHKIFIKRQPVSDGRPRRAA